MEQLRVTTLIAVAATLLCAVSPAINAANKHSYLDKKHFIYAGGYRQDGELTANSRRTASETATIELDALGVDRDYTSWMVDYHYRLNNRWKLSAAMYRFTESGLSNVLTNDLAWEGEDFSAGLALNVDWKIDTYIVDAMYSVKRSENLEISVGGGFHALDTELIVTGQVVINGVDAALEGAGETARGSIVVPLPNLRATGFYAFNEKWSAQATLGWLSLSIDEYDGSFQYAHLRGQYQITDTLGLSLGYQFVEIDVEEQLRLGSRRFDMSFQGLTAALTFAF